MASCASVQRVLQPDERILYRNQFDVQMSNGESVPSEVSKALSDMDKYVRQQPKNGLFDFYHCAGNLYYSVPLSDSSWWARTMRTLGTAPVIYSESQSILSARQITSLLESRGCFHSTVTIDTQHLSRQRIAVTYHITATPRYLIDDIVYRTSDTAIQALLDEWEGDSYLHLGDYYDQDNLVSEREMISSRLRFRGYYLATTDLIHFVVDTTYAAERLGIDVVIDNPKEEISGRKKQRPFQKYYIDQINIDSNNVSESTIRRVLTLRSGMLFNPYRTTSSYNSLLNLRNFNLINIDYQESPNSSDRMRLLDAHIRLHNSSQQKISASLEISNASPIAKQSTNSGNFGAETVLQYQHKNLFGGAELLSISGNFLVELNKSVLTNGFSDFRTSFSAFETGLSVSLDLPQFLFPWGHRLVKDISLPHTLFNIGADRQYRTYFERWQANTAFGYTWNATRQIQHKVLPMELSYVQFPMLSDAFISRIIRVLDNRILYQYSDHFILDARYEFTYNNQRMGRKNDFSYFNASVESAGNLAALIATSPGQRHRDEYDEAYTLANVTYSQYLRLSAEYKHYFYHGTQSVFVVRTLLGLGIPYGNSSTMPYEKSFFGGGPNNVRAWQIRHLGPGHYADDDAYGFDQMGDISFVLNLENRFPVFGPIEGAIFADMGNVWLYREDEYMPGADFRFHNIISDMALGIGLGIRLKISILTLRLDLSLPAYDPGFAADKRWRFSQWRFNSINTNFGIDYPF